MFTFPMTLYSGGFSPLSIAGLKLWLEGNVSTYQRSASGSITTITVTSNIASVVTATAHGMVTGSTAHIVGNAAVPDGNYVLTSALTTTTFTFAITEANVGATAGGTWTDYTPAAADGDPVGWWVDQSGVGNDVTQTTAANRPTLKTGANGLNSLPVLTTDGVNDFIQSTFTALSQPNTIFIVSKPQGVGHLDFQFDGADTNNRNALYDSGSNTWNLYAGSPADTSLVHGTSWAYFTAIYDGASSSLRASGTASSSVNPSTQALGGIVLGSAVNQGAYTTYSLAEVLVYNAHLSAADIASVEGYLKAKYAL